MGTTDGDISMLKQQSIASAKKRILANTIPNEYGCAEWQLARDKKGYGRIKVGGRLLLAHRVAYELFMGEIPLGFDVCHTCDNPGCVNIAHLFVGTRSENMVDCVKKDRCWRGGSPPHGKGMAHSQAKLSDAAIHEI